MKKLIVITSLFYLFNSCTIIDTDEPGNLVRKTVDEDASLPSITLSATQLHYQSFGNRDNEKIFMLEGGPGSDFRYLLDMNKMVNGWSLPQNYEVIYHDYRGSGLSKRHPMSELSIHVLLKDLEELIDRFAPNQRVILIGHSHGGFVAAQYVNAHPERVKGVVFIEPGAFSRAINDKTIKVTDIDYFGKDINKIMWFRQLISANNHVKGDYQYGLIFANYTDPQRGQSCNSKGYRFGSAIALAVAWDEVNKGQYDYTTNLRNFTPKALFISSDQTKDIGYDFQQAHQVDLFPNHQHIKVVGTGHAGIINCRTDETLGYIKAYLEGL
ncbi:MAG TPA: alpha/beta hydrolase [Flavobacterium sp.]|jgi:proline iminopeptidase